MNDVQPCQVIQFRRAPSASPSSLTECLAEILRPAENPGSKIGQKLAVRLMQALAPEMSEAEQIRALFSTLEAAATSPTPELALLRRTDERRILAAFELARRYHFYRERPVEQTLYQEDVEKQALRSVTTHWRNLSLEWLGFVPICEKRVGNFCVAALGVRTHVNIDPMELFARVLVLRPQAMLLFHNHPSGELTPSLSDFDLTRNVEIICRKLGIKLLAHWIVSGANERKIQMGGLS